MAEYREDKNERFINPYNFVSINNKSAERSQNAELIRESSKALYTGFFECELVNKTPLAIPDVFSATEDKEIKEHFQYPAFRIGDDIIIPGGSIRGPIRSMYEALTNSCMVTMDSTEHITRRSELGSFSPCVLKKIGNDWKLYRAKRYAVVGDKKYGYSGLQGEYTTFKVIKEGNGNNQAKYILRDNEKIAFGDEVEIEEGGPGHIKFNKKRKTQTEVWKNGSVKDIKRASGTNCFLFLGEMIENKHAESVFKVESTKPENISSDRIKGALKALEDTLAIYRSSSNRNLGQKHFGYRGYEKAKESGAIPLWYKYEEEKLHLSIAAIGRIAYQNDMASISNGHKPCVDRKRLCPACSIFGMVGAKENDKQGSGLGSHIRITDAKLYKGGTIKPMITLKELGSPNPSFLKFYSTDGKEYDQNGATIRGRKYYWHNACAADDSSIYQTSDKTNRNATMELIENDSKFSFKIYYNNLSQEQIDNLAWAITLGGNESLCMYKIGHGKPLGLGSCKIIIKEVCQRVFSDDHKYSVESRRGENDYKEIELPTGIDKDAWEQIRIISKFEKNEIQVRYPYLTKSAEVVNVINEKDKKDKVLKDNVLASHKWFSKCKDGDLVLPVIGEAINNNLSLHPQMLYKLEDKDFSDKKYPIVEVAISRISKNGALIFVDNGNEGMVSAKDVNNGHFKKGDKIRVQFEREKTFDKGKTRFYKLVP